MATAIASPKKGPAKNKPKAVSAATAGPAGTTRLRPVRALTKEVSGIKEFSRAGVRKSLKEGLSFKAIEQLEIGLNASQKEVAQILGIPPSTMTRRKKSGRLEVDESDRAIRFAQLKDQALALMQGDDEAAIAWLRMPLDLLEGETPLERASTEFGARDVEDLIGRLRHGVFS